MRRLLPGLLVAATAIALATYAWLGAYVRYIADDYCTAAILASKGFWGSQFYWYGAWSGRFSFTFLVAVFESLGPRLAPLLPALTIALWIAVAIGSTRSAAAIVVVYATIDGAPDPFQSLLWQTGMLSYGAPLVLMTGWCGAYLRRDRERISWIDAVLPFVAGGCSELAVICQIVFFTLGALFTKDRARRPFLAALGASLLALVILASAPGNAIRRSQVPPPPPLPSVLAAAAVHTDYWIGDELIAAAIPLALVFAAAALLKPVEPSRKAIAFAVLLIVGCGAACQLFTFAVSMTPPARSLIVPHFFAVIGVAILGAAAGARIPERALVLALAAAIIAGPLVTSYRNLLRITPARAFARQWDGLDADLRRGPRTPRLVSAPDTVGGLSFITSDERHWANRCVADYYRLPSIRSAASR